MLGIDPGSWISNLVGAIGTLFIDVFEWLLNQLAMLIGWIFSLLPALPLWPSGSSVDRNTAVSNTLSWMVSILNVWNYYLAINLAIVLATTALAAEAVSAIWHIVRWLLAKIPFIGGEEGS